MSTSSTTSEGNSLERPGDTEAGVPAAFPLIQPMKAAFYFDSIVGFGEWRILISTRADSNLREARRKKPKLVFAIILKKLKYVTMEYVYVALI